MTNKEKRADARLKALELRAKGATDKEASEQTGFYPSTVSRLVSKYRKNGIEAISGNHYGGNHRNMSVEEEAEILAPFRERKVIHSDKEIRLMFQYEASFGRINKPKYCWCEKGVRPSVPCHHFREYYYAFGAVEPLTEDNFFIEYQYKYHQWGSIRSPMTCFV